MKRYSLVGLLTLLIAVTVWAAIIEVPEAPARMTAIVAGGGGGAAPAGINLALDINNGQSGGTNTTIVAKPDNTVDGDFLLAAMSIGTSAGTITPPSGWTQMATYMYASEYVLRVWYKRASSEGASWTWTTASGGYSDSIVWRITGVVASGDPLDVAVSTNTGDSNPLSSTGITTNTNGAAVIQFISTSNDYSSLSTTTLTERFDNGVIIGATGDVQASAGASGNKAATLGVARTWGTILLALKPAT